MPRVLTRAQCASLIEAYGPLERLAIDIPGERSFDGQRAIPTRTGYGTQLPESHEAVAALQLKVAEVTGLPVSHQEWWRGLRYETGQRFGAHCDFFADQFDTPRRLYSALVYLNEDFGGGQTVFSHLRRVIKPEAGKLVWWNNYDKRGRPLIYSSHAGLVVTSGVKYVAACWVRAERYPGDILY